MLPFRVREDALVWFRELYSRKEFRINFDAFYFCFIAGIASRRKMNCAQDETPELVSYFPDNYNGIRGQSLIALFLKAELDELGVAMDEKGEKRDVHAAIARLVDYSSLSKLSADGVTQFNQYAHGGFEVLTEWFDDRPRSLETFLRAFKLKLDDSLTSEAEA
jgi:hypothetical protein